jgi:hypothetical protein
MEINKDNVEAIRNDEGLFHPACFFEENGPEAVDELEAENFMTGDDLVDGILYFCDICKKRI